MLYKLKLYLYKNKLIKKIYKLLFKREKTGQKDIRYFLIEKYSKDKTFIDIGCMWGVNGFFSFLAEEAGAKEITGFDIFPESDEFKRIHKERNSKVKFRQGDINSGKTLNEIGKFDVVYCTGLLYHVPDPIYTLSRLRQISSNILILGTAVIPEINGFKNMAVYYPFLNIEERKIWDLKEGIQLAITTPYDPKQGYGNWLWGFTNSCLESMLKATGFNIVDKFGGKFYTYIVCDLSEKEFLPVSGDWSVPEFKENIKKYKFD